jgi:hypothetical protein
MELKDFKFFSQQNTERELCGSCIKRSRKMRLTRRIDLAWAFGEAAPFGSPPMMT